MYDLLCLIALQTFYTYCYDRDNSRHPVKGVYQRRIYELQLYKKSPLPQTTFTDCTSFALNKIL